RLAIVDVKEMFGIDIEQGEWREYAFGTWEDEWGVVVKVFIDGEEVINVTDHTDKAMKGGKVGVGCPGNNKVYYDDVKIGGVKTSLGSFYEVTGTGDGKYILDDGLYRPLTSEEDLSGNKIIRSHRVIELEGTVYMVSHDATTDTYYIEDVTGEEVAVKTGEQVEVRGVLYDVTGTCADDLKLVSVETQISEDITEKVIRHFRGSYDEYYTLAESIRDGVAGESTQLAQDPPIIRLPDLDTRIEDDFSSALTENWYFSKGDWVIGTERLYQNDYNGYGSYMGGSTGDMKAIYVIDPEETKPRRQADDIIRASIMTDNYALYQNYDGLAAGDLYVRYIDDNNFYRARFWEDDTVVIQRKYRGDLVDLASVDINTGFGIDIIRDQWNDMMFSVCGGEAIGVELRAFVNGQEVLSVIDDSRSIHTNGNPGVGCSPDSQSYFDDMRIDYIDIDRGVYYTVDKDGEGKYVLTDIDTSDSYVDEDDDKEIAVRGARYLIDDTDPERIILTEKAASSEQQDWIDLEGIYYLVTSTATTDVYMLDDGINAPIQVQAGYTTEIDSVVYNVTATGTGDLELESLDFTKISQHAATLGINIRGTNYAVGSYTTGTGEARCELYNNEWYLRESIDGFIIAGADLLKVSGEGETTQLAMSSSADLDNDGDVDAADEAIIAAAMTTGTYDILADVDKDGVVDAVDLGLFRRWMSDTALLSVVQFEGEEYYMTNAGDDVYTLENRTTGERITGGVGSDGAPFITAGGVRCFIEDDGIFDRTGTVRMVEDMRLYTVHDGEMEIGSGTLVEGQFATRGGLVYTISGTCLDDITIEAPHGMRFDGSNDYIDTHADFSWAREEEFSIGFWINPSVTSGEYGILGTSAEEWYFKIIDGNIEFRY
ncbi:MAG: hypothetical protein WBD17_03595, partial [Candidatus Omnitrophota bacterium]